MVSSRAPAAIRRGSGKTLAYLLPAVQRARLADEVFPKHGIGSGHRHTHMYIIYNYNYNFWISMKS
jgi:hypothetical protein